MCLGRMPTLSHNTVQGISPVPSPQSPFRSKQTPVVATFTLLHASPVKRIFHRSPIGHRRLFSLYRRPSSRQSRTCDSRDCGGAMALKTAPYRRHRCVFIQETHKKSGFGIDAYNRYTNGPKWKGGQQFEQKGKAYGLRQRSTPTVGYKCTRGILNRQWQKRIWIEEALTITKVRDRSVIFIARIAQNYRLFLACAHIWIYRKSGRPSFGVSGTLGLLVPSQDYSLIAICVSRRGSHRPREHRECDMIRWTNTPVNVRTLCSQPRGFPILARFPADEDESRPGPTGQDGAQGQEGCSSSPPVSYLLYSVRNCIKVSGTSLRWDDREKTLKNNGINYVIPLNYPGTRISNHLLPS